MTDGREAAREPGELVRDVWVAWAREQPDVADHASWTVAWEALSARDREVDARIEATIRRDERERASESALRAAAREALIKEGARPMLTVDDRCKSPECTEKDIYRMVGKCANCHAEPVLVLFTVGHEARQVSCPSCGVERVYTTRLATPEEIPLA